MGDLVDDSIGWKFDSSNTFCISLETSVDRRERMQQRFAWFGLDVSFCRAATPEEVTVKCIGYMNPGQRACAQSHINLWQYLWARQLPYALVLEDDAMFDLAWREKLDRLWWMLYGGSGGGRLWHAIFLNCSDPVRPRDTWVCASEQFFTGAYVVSLEGVRNILGIMDGLFKGIVYSSDWTTSRLQELGRCWTYFPWLVVQEGRDSLIGSGVDLDHKKVLRCLGEVGYDLSGNYR